MKVAKTGRHEAELLCGLEVGVVRYLYNRLKA